MDTEDVIDVNMVANHKRKSSQDHNAGTNRRKLNKVEIPDEFLCPITQELMEDPVSTEDGHVYDRKSIEQWFKDHHTSPTTNVRLKSKKLIPNLFAKKQIQQFKELNHICSADEFFSYVQNGNLTKLQNTNFPDSYLTQYTSVEWTIGKNAISAAAMHIAVHHRHLEVLKWLLEQGVNVDFPILSAKPAASGATALHYAAHLGFIDCMHILLAAGAKHTRYYFSVASNFPSVTEWGITPLHWCSNPEAVELLIHQGANVNIQAPGNSNFTPLHYAAWNNSTTLANCLLKFGAEVNTRGSNGRTPLHIAAKKGNQMVAKILMDHGANPKILDNSNRNVIDLARAYLSETMANFIEKYSEEIKEQSQN